MRCFFGDKGNESIAEWKAALTEAANISGWESPCGDHNNEAQIIQKIVQDVSEKLNLRCPIKLKVKGLVEIDKICEEVKLLFSKNHKNQLLQNVQVIGIWGMGGIGKTTIAKALFSQLFPQYDCVCFLANVREESKRRGLTSLHEELLSKLPKDEQHVAGSTIIIRRLGNKKVLIVLDDVDSLDQLGVLCAECGYAGPDSKIIVTTRNRHLLISAGVDEIYDVKTLSFAQSLELFSLHAFKQRHPKKGYEDLSRRAVNYAGGVPLVLKVLGSNLYSRSEEFWESELSKLMNCPNDKIQSVLQVSYDGLDILQKKIFLDIAFFFKGEDKDDVIRILDACGFYATSGVQLLVDKALINISNTGTIQMHDLIEDMGLNIVRQGMEVPGSRLRDIEEVSDVLENKKGSDVIEGIKLDLSQIDDLQMNAEAFNKMTSLRILKLYIPSGKQSGKVYYPMALIKLPGKLRYLEWNGYPLKSLPANFNVRMLVEIRMPHSHVTELWQGVKDVVNLVRIDLSECKRLKNLPDLSKASKLEWVNLSGCKNLVAVHPSVLSLDTLETLILDNCKRLKSLKGVKHLTSLENISVNGCTSLREFSVSSDSIKILDLGLEFLKRSPLEVLNISANSCTSPRELSPSSDSIKDLDLGNTEVELHIRSQEKDLKEHHMVCACCESIITRKVILRRRKRRVFDGLTSLQLLHLKDCCNLCELPNMGRLSRLKELRLDGSSVKTLPWGIKHLKNLEIISLVNCRKLERLGELPPSVKKLEAMNCSSLVTVSTLNFFAVDMRKKQKFVSFENCIRLDEHSLISIMDDAYLAFSNVVLPKNNWWNICTRLQILKKLEGSAKACFPGSGVPEQFTYRTTQSSIIINLPSSKSDFECLFMCVVLSPSLGIKTDGAKIWCQCFLPDGTKLGDTTTWHDEAVMINELNSDHVYMWCDPRHCYSILDIYDTAERSVTFEFFVTSVKGERDVLPIQTKECGICIVLKSKESGNCPLELESQHCETSHHNHGNETNNQEPDFSQNCSCSAHCLFDVLRYLWRLIIT